MNGHLFVDSTFAPPPLQYPFKWGTDMILHSGKHLLLLPRPFSSSRIVQGPNILVVIPIFCVVFSSSRLLINGKRFGRLYQTRNDWCLCISCIDQLWTDRTYMGNMMARVPSLPEFNSDSRWIFKGSLEAWLLLRSLRTFHLRIPRQSQTATALAQWLERVSQAKPGEEFEGVPGGTILKVWHSSLQAKTADWDVAKQMEGGWNATFSFLVCLLFFVCIDSADDRACLEGLEERACGHPTAPCQVFCRKCSPIADILELTGLDAACYKFGRGRKSD